MAVVVHKAHLPSYCYVPYSNGVRQYTGTSTTEMITSNPSERAGFLYNTIKIIAIAVIRPALRLTIAKYYIKNAKIVYIQK